MGCRVTLGADDSRDLATAFAEATVGLEVTGVAVSMIRRAGVYDVYLTASGPRTAEQNRNCEGSVNLNTVAVERLGVIVSWARATFTEAQFLHTVQDWSPQSSLEARVAELRGLFAEIAPTRVEVSRGFPTSERGEPGWGRAGVRVALARADGVEMTVELDYAETDHRDHEAIGRAFVSRGEALARSLGVACTTND